jgi:hypothetical protein
MRSSWNARSRPTDPRAPRRAVKPTLESIEDRLLLHAGVNSHLAAAAHHAPAVAASAQRNPLAPYRVFEGTITRGPAAGLTLNGPLVLGYSGRIQVIGYLFEPGGTRISVFGTDFGGGVALTFIIPTKTSSVRVLAFGSGQLNGVRGGLPDGLTLVGAGNLSGPDLKRDFGHWATVAPAKVAGV